ncbi:MAG: laminin G domain-containing protein [Clostridia bacterium]|nr:laminin G domain-containing protein [Clostridia bacterium]
MKKLTLLVSFVLALVLATSVMAAEEPLLTIDFANGDNGMELVNADLVEDPTRGQVLKINGIGGSKTCGTSYALLTTDLFAITNWEDGLTLAMWIKTDVGSQTLKGTTPIWSIDSCGIGYYSVICSMEHTCNSDGNENIYGLSPRVWNDPANVSGGMNATEEGVWQHLVTVYSTDGITIYLDGEVVAEPTLGGGTMDDLLWQIELAATGLRLGSWLCDWWNYGDYQGMIDDVALYSVALDETEVQALGKATKVAQTVFEEAPSLEDLYDGTYIAPVYTNNFDDASTVELVEAAIVTDEAQGNAVEINGAGSGANNVSYALINTDLLANTDWTQGVTISLKVKADASETLNGMAPLYSFDIANIGYIGVVTSLQSGMNTDGNDTSLGIAPRLWNDPADRDNCTSKLTAGQWQTVTVVYDENGIAIYLNDEVVLKPGINNGAFSDLAAQMKLVPALRLGAWNCDWWKYGDFEGLIDDVTIWNAALNPLQVKNFVEGVTAEVPAETEAPAETEPEVVETEPEVVETEAEVVAPAETEAEVAAPAEPEAPQTFDLGIVAIAAAVLSLGTALVSKKRR